MATVSAGEIEATLRLKDQMTAELKKINSSLGSFTDVAKTAGALVSGHGQRSARGVTLRVSPRARR